MIENKTSLRPRYADTDQMGIVYYAKYLEWFEVGRTELLRDIGLPYTTVEREGIILPVIEAHCRYHRPAKYDQLVTIVSKIGDLPRARIRIEYEIKNVHGQLLAEGYTVHSFLGKNGRPVRPPASLLGVMQPYFHKKQ